MIWIRADANSKIGSGHIMRCLAIATELKKRGKDVCFILADETSIPILRERGQCYKVLHSDYQNMEGELKNICLLLEKESPEALLIDSYFVTREYLMKVKRYTKTAYIDDKYLFSYPVDILINYNIYGDGMPYEKDELQEKRELLLGTFYSPLRQEFRQVSYQIRKQVKNILITTGGSDQYNLAGHILKNAIENPETQSFQYHVVSGVFNQNYALLKEMENNYSNITIHENVIKMSELMKQCDIAITAGGSTMYELCAIGVPIICFSFVDNQEFIVETFVKRNLVFFGGNYLKDGEELIQNVVKKMKVLADSREERLKYSKKERKLVDGLGAERIVDRLCRQIEMQKKKTMTE